MEKTSFFSVSLVFKILFLDIHLSASKKGTAVCFYLKYPPVAPGLSAQTNCIQKFVSAGKLKYETVDENRMSFFMRYSSKNSLAIAAVTLRFFYSINYQKHQND